MWAADSLPKNKEDSDFHLLMAEGLASSSPWEKFSHLAEVQIAVRTEGPNGNSMDYWAWGSFLQTLTSVSKLQKWKKKYPGFLGIGSCSSNSSLTHLSLLSLLAKLQVTNRSKGGKDPLRSFEENRKEDKYSMWATTNKQTGRVGRA